MGLLDFLSTTTNPVDDMSRGRAALAYFNNEMLQKFDYSMSLDELLLYVDGGRQDRADIFTQGIGKAINDAGMKEYQVKSAMTDLADLSGGRTPNNRDVFYKALYDRAGEITAADWVTEAPSIAADTVVQAAGDVSSAAQAGAAAVTSTASILTGIFPVVVVGAVLFVVFSRSKQLAGQ